MKVPLFSIIIPVYRAEKYLRKCIDSILLQSFTDYELILVDDGSPDNCGKIIDNYAKSDQRIKVIHKCNGGASSARNSGLDVFTGKWIIFVDSDDYLPKDALKIMADKGTSENYDLYVFEMNRLDSSGNLFIPFPLDKSKESYQDVISQMLVYKRNTGPFARTFKGDLVKKLRFNTNLIMGEDMVFNIQYMLLSKKDVVYFNDIVYVNQYNPNSITHTPETFDTYNELMHIISNILDEEQYGDYLRTFFIIGILNPCFIQYRIPSKKDLETVLNIYHRGFAASRALPNSFIVYLRLSSILRVLGQIYLLLRRGKRDLKGVYENLCMISRNIFNCIQRSKDVQ
jgi:glycosyltransferase involved in cell wall biosynthesis